MSIMNRPFWFTLIVSATICLGATLRQSARTSELQQRLAAAKAQLKPPLKQSQVAAPTADELTPEKIEKDEQDASANRVQRVLTDVIKMQPNTLSISPLLTKTNLTPTEWVTVDWGMVEAEHLKGFPGFLRSVEGLSADELIAVAQSLPRNHAGHRRTHPRHRDWLLLLAAEKDPQRVLQDASLMTEEMEQKVIALLAWENPAAVLRRLGPMKKLTGEPTNGKRMANMGDWKEATRVRCAIRLLGVDFDQGMRALTDIHDNYLYIPAGVGGTLGNASVPESAIPRLIEAAGRPEYAKMRDDLIELTLRHELYDGGVPAAARTAESMNLTPEELKTIFDDLVRNDVMEAEPVALLEWMANTQPERVPEATLKWADLDIKSTCDWLGKLPPSKMRDRTLSEFAVRAGKLDPDAAALWATEIEDQTERRGTLLRVVRNNPTSERIRFLLEQTPGDRQENLSGLLREPRVLLGSSKRDIRFREELMGQMTAAELSVAFESLFNRKYNRAQKRLIRQRFEGTLSGLGHSAEEIGRMLPMWKKPGPSGGTQRQ